MLRLAGDAADLLAAPVVHARQTRIRAHRPWPMPRRPWVMGQTWADLLFAHWSLDPEQVREHVPPELPLDLRDGRAWVAVTPFAVRNLRARLTLPVPLLSSFPEINVRTYVDAGGRPGIWFVSLDAGSALAVAAARRLYRLPYFKALMAIEHDGDGIGYRSERRDPDGLSAEFRARYEPAGAEFEPVPGTLEHWLTERYCLYTLDDERRVLRAEIHHRPWTLRPARASIEANTMAAAAGLALDGEPLLHYARRQDVVFWTLEPVA